MEALFAAPIGALLIFLLRVVDVSMAIIRVIVAVRGYRRTAAAIGFVEVLIWLVAAGHAFDHLDSPLHVVGFAGGFAAGNYVGIWLEGRLAMGLHVVRAVFGTKADSDGAAAGHRAAVALRDAGHAVTEITGRGRSSDVDILNVVVRRRLVPRVVRVLQDQDPDVFVTVEEVSSVHGGYIQPGGRKMPALGRT